MVSSNGSGVSSPLRADLLTHTTLKIGRCLSAESLAQIVHALRRVPGVLTAETDAIDAQAFVAHDSAVPPSALIAAASVDGAPAGIVRDTRVPLPETAVAAVRPAFGSQQRVIAGLFVIAGMLVVDFAIPNTPDKRWLIVAPVVLLWAFMLAGAFAGRRRS